MSPSTLFHRSQIVFVGLMAALVTQPLPIGPTRLPALFSPWLKGFRGVGNQASWCHSDGNAYGAPKRRVRVREAVRARECPVSASEAAPELPNLSGEMPVSQAPGRARGGRWGRRDGGKKREVLSGPHRARFHPHRPQRTKNKRRQTPSCLRSLPLTAGMAE